MFTQFLEFQCSPTTLEDAQNYFTQPTNEIEENYRINRKGLNELPFSIPSGMYRVMNSQLVKISAINYNQQ